MEIVQAAEAVGYGAVKQVVISILLHAVMTIFYQNQI